MTNKSAAKRSSSQKKNSKKSTTTHHASPKIKSKKSAKHRPSPKSKSKKSTTVQSSPQEKKSDQLTPARRSPRAKKQVIKSGTVPQKPKAERKSSGGGTFNRCSNSDILAIAKTVKTEKILKKGEQKKASILTPKRNTTSTSQSSPSDPLRSHWEESKHYVSGKNVETLESTPGGGRAKVKTTTPRGRVFVRSFKIYVTKIVSETEKVTILAEFFQTEDSAKYDKEVKRATPEKLKKIKESIPRPAAIEYKIDDVQISASDLTTPTRRVYSHSEPAKDICTAFTDKLIPCDHSHLFQHSIGDILASAVLTDEAIALGIDPDSFLTIPAPATHNSTRLVTVEIPGIKAFIKINGCLLASSAIQLFKDDIGAIPLLKTETTSWRDKQGNTVKVIFDVWNGIKPARQHQSLMQKTCNYAWGEPNVNKTLFFGTPDTSKKRPRDDEDNELSQSPEKTTKLTTPGITS